MLRDISAVVFDVLGTLVDEPHGIMTAVREATGVDDASAERLLATWQRHIEHEQQRMAEGERPYADSRTLDREAAELVLQQAGVGGAAAVERLSTAAERHPAWEGSAEGLRRLAGRFRVFGLSNAEPRTLERLGRHSDLSWHRALSADAVHAYKPDAAVYRLAVEEAGVAPQQVLMVAAHAWDLRGAQAIGMRTAYVQRPVGDPPRDGDDFDGQFRGLDELYEALAAG